MRVATAVAIVAAFAWAAPAAAKIQCWTDKNGQRMCGDRVPPEYAGQKREVMQDGRVVDTIAAPKTAEERAEERARQEQAEAAKRQADYDRALLETYRSPKDIESMRDERLAMIDGRLASLEKNSATTNADLERLRAQAAEQEKAGKEVSPKLAKQIKELERAQRQNQKSLERNQKERAEIETKFNSDLERYYDLRGGRPEPKKPEAAQPATPATPAKPGEAPAQPATPAEPAKH